MKQVRIERKIKGHLPSSGKFTTRSYITDHGNVVQGTINVVHPILEQKFNVVEPYGMKPIFEIIKLMAEDPDVEITDVQTIEGQTPFTSLKIEYKGL